jgi:hypothetical protein
MSLFDIKKNDVDEFLTSSSGNTTTTTTTTNANGVLELFLFKCELSLKS